MKAEKLSDAIGLLDEELLAQADTAGEDFRAEHRRKLRLHMILLAVFCAAFAILLILTSDREEQEAAWAYEAVFDGTEPIPAAGLAQEGLLGGTVDLSTTDYAIKCFPEGETPTVSPVKDNTQVKKMAVYRSVRAASFNDIYALLCGWADMLADRAEERLGIPLDYNLNRITASGADVPGDYYDPQSPPDYRDLGVLRLELTRDEAVLTLTAWSEYGVTYCDLKGLEALYAQAESTECPAVAAADRDALAEACLPAVSFANELLGTRFSKEHCRVLDIGEEDRVMIDFTWAGLPGGSPQSLAVLETVSGGIDQRLFFDMRKADDGLFHLSRISVSLEYVTYLGEYELISRQEAEELLQQGYFYGGLHCPVCWQGAEAADFSDVDLVQIEYYGQAMEYKIPWYAFYHHMGQEQTEGWPVQEKYAVVFVPAVKAEGLEDFFAELAALHAAEGHKKAQ